MDSSVILLSPNAPSDGYLAAFLRFDMYSNKARFQVIVAQCDIRCPSPHMSPAGCVVPPQTRPLESSSRENVLLVALGGSISRLGCSMIPE